ncbi:integrase catalytic domain-containing protein [Trichonephila clavipes]|nr:integrase catalytic domain-containing protein [Trichonephila clavipes]
MRYTFRSCITVETCKQGSRGNANDYRCYDYLYTDSTIVLSWIRTQPHRLKCFVVNRVVQITDFTSTFEWHHINSKDNPADPLSRGLSVDDLNRNNIWWFLQKLQKRNVDDIFLTSREPNHARDALIRQAQTQKFNAELKALRLGNNIQPQNLKKLHNLVMRPDEKVSSFLSTEGLYWKFIPPKFPNFGGIREAGVKSFKLHAKRIIAEVENFEILTPGHFLIGRVLNAIVEPDLCTVNTNKLDKYRKITKIEQNI